MALNWVFNSLTYVQQDDVCRVCAATGWWAMWGTDGRAPMVSQRKNEAEIRREKEKKKMNCHTFRSPEMLAPARMPVAEGKKMENMPKKLPSAPRQLGTKLAAKISAVKGEIFSLTAGKQFISITIPHKHSVHSLHNSFTFKKLCHLCSWKTLWLVSAAKQEGAFLQSNWRMTPWWPGRTGSVPGHEPSRAAHQFIVMKVFTPHIDKTGAAIYEPPREFTMHPNLGLPRHASQWDAQQTSDGDDADDADVVGAVDHDGSVLLQEKFQEDFKRMKQAYRRWSKKHTHTHEFCDCLSKPHGVHGYSHSVGKGKDQPDGSTQLWTQTPTDEEVGPTWRQEQEVDISILSISMLVDCTKRIGLTGWVMCCWVNRPPLTLPLVAMAEVERPVMPVIREDSRMMTQVRPDGETLNDCEPECDSHRVDLLSNDTHTHTHTYTSLSSDPWQPQVQDHPPDIQHATDLQDKQLLTEITESTSRTTTWPLGSSGLVRQHGILSFVPHNNNNNNNTWLTADDVPWLPAPSRSE